MHAYTKQESYCISLPSPDPSRGPPVREGVNRWLTGKTVHYRGIHISPPIDQPEIKGDAARQTTRNNTSDAQAAGAPQKEGDVQAAEATEIGMLRQLATSQVRQKKACRQL